MEEEEEERKHVGSVLWIVAAFLWDTQEIYSYFISDKWKKEKREDQGKKLGEKHCIALESESQQNACTRRLSGYHVSERVIQYYWYYC